MAVIREGVKEKLRTMGSPALDSGLRKRSKAQRGLGQALGALLGLCSNCRAIVRA